MTEPDGFTLPADAAPVLRDAHAYWHSLRPARELLPGRQHLDPLAIPRLLPFAWLIEVHPPASGSDIPRFRFRLVGSHVDLGFGGARTGRWLDEAEPNFSSSPQMHEPFVSCVRKVQPSYRRGRPRMLFNANAAELERIILPLAADGRHVDMLFGCTVFYDSSGDVLRPSF